MTSQTSQGPLHRGLAYGISLNLFSRQGLFINYITKFVYVAPSHGISLLHLASYITDMFIIYQSTRWCNVLLFSHLHSSSVGVDHLIRLIHIYFYMCRKGLKIDSGQVTYIDGSHSVVRISPVPNYLRSMPNF